MHCNTPLFPAPPSLVRNADGSSAPGSRASAATRFARCLLVLLCLVASAASLHAQFESASVLGYVRDNSGAALPNAAVTLTNTGTNVAQKAKTDAEGKYEFNSVNIGSYVVSAEVTGFANTRTQTFQLSVSARQRVDVEMKPGAVSETIEVSSGGAVARNRNELALYGYRHEAGGRSSAERSLVRGSCAPCSGRT